MLAKLDLPFWTPTVHFLDPHKDFPQFAEIDFVFEFGKIEPFLFLTLINCGVWESQKVPNPLILLHIGMLDNFQMSVN